MFWLGKYVWACDQHDRSTIQQYFVKFLQIAGRMSVDWCLDSKFKSCLNKPNTAISKVCNQTLHYTFDSMWNTGYVHCTGHTNFDVTTADCKINVIFREFTVFVAIKAMICDVAMLHVKTFLCTVAINSMDINLILQPAHNDVKIGPPVHMEID